MSIFRNLPYDLRQTVEGELNGNETVVWAGQPKPGRMAMTALPKMLFAIPFTAFSIFWICGASGFEMPDFSEGGFAFFPLFGLPFLIVGLGMLGSPLWKMKSAKNTVYVLTDKRAIIFEGGRKINIHSFSGYQLRGLSRKQRADGSGDIIFAKEVSHHNRDGRTQFKEVGFIGIDNVKQVEDRIRAIA